MRWLLLALIVIGLVALIALRRRSGANQVPEIVSGGEEGFHDLVFALILHERRSDGSQRLRLAGTHGGERVELDVELDASWTRGELGDTGITTHGGDVRLRSVGAASDEFVKVLDRIYETEITPRHMAATTAFTAASLEGDPGRLDAGPTKLKLFFESEHDDRYAELYLNVDVRSSRVELIEKDEEYRAAIVLALAGT